MNSEIEQYAEVVRSASIAMLVYANDDCTDIEMIRMKPSLPSEAERAKMAPWEGRDLREVGVFALTDAAPVVCLCALISEDEYIRILERFQFYCESLIQCTFQVFRERCIRGLDRDGKVADEIAELERLFALPDLRS